MPQTSQVSASTHCYVNNLYLNAISATDILRLGLVILAISKSTLMQTDDNVVFFDSDGQTTLYLRLFSKARNSVLSCFVVLHVSHPYWTAGLIHVMNTDYPHGTPDTSIGARIPPQHYHHSQITNCSCSMLVDMSSMMPSEWLVLYGANFYSGSKQWVFFLVSGVQFSRAK